LSKSKKDASKLPSKGEKMVTPTKAEIVKLATESWHKDQLRKGNPAFDIEPELSELREGGYLSYAQSELMRNPNHDEWEGFNERLETFQKTLKNEQQNNVKLKSVIDDILNYDDLLLIANKGQGKTNALKVLSSELRKLPNTRVIIFETFPKFCLEFESMPFMKIHDKDVTETKHTIDLESYFLRHERDYTVKRGQEIREALNKNKDMIFTLEIKDIERIAFFVYSVVNHFYRRAYLRLYKKYKKKERVIFIIEESQNCFDSSTISKKLFNRLRKIFSEARNLDLHFVMCSQRLQDLNTKIRGRTRLMLGNVSLDDYELKVRRLLRNSKYRIEILNFERGQFLYTATDTVIKFPKFATQEKPYELIYKPKQEPQTENDLWRQSIPKPKRKPSLLKRFLNWIIFPLSITEKPRNRKETKNQSQNEEEDETEEDTAFGVPIDMLEENED